MSYRDIFIRRVPRPETSILMTVVLLLHLLQMAESMMATYRQSTHITHITEYRIQASAHQKKLGNALNRLLIGFIPKSVDRCPE